MSTYFDIIPPELAAQCIPHDDVNTLFKVLKNPLPVFISYIGILYPGYHAVYKYDHPNMTIEQISQKMLDYIMKNDINDFEDIRDEMLAHYYNYGEIDTKLSDLFHPYILIELYPKVFRYIRDKLTYGSDWIADVFKRYGPELYHDVTMLLYTLRLNENFYFWQMPSEIKIELLKLSGIDISSLTISYDDLDALKYGSDDEILLYNFLTTNHIKVA